MAVFSAAAFRSAFSASIFSSATFFAAATSTLGATGVIIALGVGAAITFGAGGATTLGAATTAALGAVTVLTTAVGVVTFFTSFTSEPVVATRTAERAIADPNPAALNLIPFLVSSLSAVSLPERSSLIPSFNPAPKDFV